MEKKICKKCNQLKYMDEFHIDSGHKDGRKNKCKLCRNHEQKIAQRQRQLTIHPKSRQEYNTSYYHRNRKRCRAIKRNSANKRYKKIKSLPQEFSDSDRKYLFDYFGHSCIVCNATGNLQTDHFIPLSKDNHMGTVRQNIILLCSSCNSRKHAMLPDEWYKTLGHKVGARVKNKIESYFQTFVD